MKRKKEYVILAVLIVALSLYLVFRNTNRTHYQLPKIPPVTKADISKIEIDSGGAALILEKKGTEWEISPQGYRADPAKVKGMLNTLETLSLTALASEAKDYSRYDLGEDKKVRVRAWTSGTLDRDFDIGKPAPTYRHTFVRLSGDPRVYHARENFREKFDQSVGDLRDKTVLSFDRRDIRQISIRKEKQSLVLTRKEPSPEPKTPQGETPKPASQPKPEEIWESAEGRKGDREEVHRILDVLSTLRCEDFLEGAKEDFSEPLYEIGLKGSRDYTLSIFAAKDPEGKSHPALSSENPFPFLLSDWQVEKIMEDPSRLLEGTEKP